MSGGSWEAMTTAELLDRRALAAELTEIAARFVDEAERCSTSEDAARCGSVAVELWRHVRVLDDPSLTVDLARSRGLAEAGTLILAQLEGARRFYRSVTAVDEYMTRAEGRRL